MSSGYAELGTVRATVSEMQESVYCYCFTAVAAGLKFVFLLRSLLLFACGGDVDVNM